MKTNKPKKISTFDTRFLIFFLFATSVYHYGVKFYLDDTQYILRMPYVWGTKTLSYFSHVLFHNKVLRATQDENTQLKRQIFLKHNMDTYVPVQHVMVLQYFDTGLNRTLLIPNHLFQVGDIVTTRGYLVGRIVSMGKNVATVELITDQASKVPVVFCGYNGIACGKNPTSLSITRLDKRPQDCPIAAPIYTSGIDGLYPKNLLLGKIIHIEKDCVIAQCDLDFKTVDTVEVMRYK